MKEQTKNYIAIAIIIIILIGLLFIYADYQNKQYQKKNSDKTSESLQEDIDYCEGITDTRYEFNKCMEALELKLECVPDETGRGC